MQKMPNNKHSEPGMCYRSGKVYTHSLGLSCAFRQWRAESHCRLIHGYALQFEVTFRAVELDARNWVVDFGSMKSFKGALENWFDHTLLVAEDDPHLETFKQLEVLGLCNLRILPNVGMEATAFTAYQILESWLVDNGYSPRVKLEKVVVREHEGNWAEYGRQ